MIPQILAMIAPSPMTAPITNAPKPAIPPAEFPKRTIEPMSTTRYFM